MPDQFRKLLIADIKTEIMFNGVNGVLDLISAEPALMGLDIIIGDGDCLPAEKTVGTGPFKILMSPADILRSLQQVTDKTVGGDLSGGF